MSVTPQRRHAWRLVQIAELLRRGHRAHEEALAHVERLEVAAVLGGDGRITLTEALAGELEALGDTIGELALHLQLLTSELPTESIDVTVDEVLREAAHDLAGGIFDEARALLAARVLPRERGWPALAEALRGSDAHWAWETLGAGRLLGEFRGAATDRVARVLGEAGVPPETPFAGCSSEDVLCLASALDRHCRT